MKQNIKIAKELIKIAKELTFEQQDELLIALHDNNLQPNKRAEVIQHFIQKGGNDLYNLLYCNCNLLPNEKEYVLDKIFQEDVADPYWFVGELKKEKNTTIREKILNYLYNNKYAGEFIIEAIAYNYLTEQELSKWGRLIINKLSKEELKNLLNQYMNNYLIDFIVNLIK